MKNILLMFAQLLVVSVYGYAQYKLLMSEQTCVVQICMYLVIIVMLFVMSNLMHRMLK
jgi:hypothetical protein